MIKISFLLKDSLALAPDSKINAPRLLNDNYAPVLQNENSTLLKGRDSVENSSGACFSPAQTSELEVPNIIHGSKQLNLT